MVANKKKGRPFTGTHVFGELWSVDENLLKQSKIVKSFIKKLLRKHRLKELGSLLHSFPGGGFTAIFNLSESHIALHTWPEFNYLTLDIFICNFKRDNSSVCVKLFNELKKFFKAKQSRRNIIKR